VARAGARVQPRPAEVPGVTRASAEGAGKPVLHQEFSRRNAERRRSSARPAGCAHERLDPGAEASRQGRREITSGVLHCVCSVHRHYRHNIQYRRSAPLGGSLLGYALPRSAAKPTAENLLRQRIRVLRWPDRSAGCARSIPNLRIIDPRHATHPPRRVIKQIVAMFLSANSPETGRINDGRGLRLERRTLRTSGRHSR